MKLKRAKKKLIKQQAQLWKETKENQNRQSQDSATVMPKVSSYLDSIRDPEHSLVHEDHEKSFGVKAQVQLYNHSVTRDQLLDEMNAKSDESRVPLKEVDD